MQRIIGISSGDPSGIGLEVVLKAFPAITGSARWVLYTDAPAFDRHYVRFGAGLPYKWIASPEDAQDHTVLHLIETPGASCPIPWGDVQKSAGERAVAYLKAAGEAALRQQISAIVTAPVHKGAIGGSFKGQTDFLADQARVKRFAMAFFTPTFKVVLATVHLSLRDALAKLSTALYVELIRLVNQELSRFGYASPSIALAGVNPHAGEDGLFGNEELELLAPAIQQCEREGIRVSGPYSADSLYYRAHTGEFDVVIAPYHDQGLAPVKLIAHGQSTNVTLGLPYVRTSPDHGTALSIAGKGLADPEGMISAMRCAVDLCNRAS
ncbi:MAG TPA: 4-hydroxythreonine-4-phosphate dehydrogenase PdxA [Terriglobia bacterium]|nr:4-hydroxythreonine-4-phosphate dehydrogenase PdxA [Terriglobia bacterium]